MKATKIKWETDGQKVSLPKTVKIPQEVIVEAVNDYLSDTYGWLVDCYELD